MTTPPPRRSPESPDPALLAFSRHLDAMDQRQDELVRSVNTLGEIVTGISRRVTAETNRPAAPSWLGLATEPQRSQTRISAVLTDLTDWVATVFRHYADGDAALPDCWLRHPDVVEELLWLRTVWGAAYRSPSASAVLAGDWHDRYRPGVARRIRTAAATCSAENHGGESTASFRPDSTEVEAAVAWWTKDREAEQRPAPDGPPA
jgi:hypothetical protein